MAIAGFVRKMSGTSEVDTETMNIAVSKMVEEALKYNQVESILESSEEEDIFSPEYFEKLSDVKMRKETHGLIIVYGWFDYFSNRNIKILFNFCHFINFLLYHDHEFYSIKSA